MTAYPVFVNGAAVTALLVGGGAVAARKLGALLAAGVRVRVVAPRLHPDMEALCADAAVTVDRARYSGDHIRDAQLVFAATGSRSVNKRVAADARSLGRLVNIADDGNGSDFHTAATVRRGPLAVAVHGGGVPAAAARVRDHISAHLPNDLGDAVELLREVREQLLARGEGELWQRLSMALVDDDFVARVENGALAEELRTWR